MGVIELNNIFGICNFNSQASRYFCNIPATSVQRQFNFKGSIINDMLQKNNRKSGSNGFIDIILCVSSPDDSDLNR